MTFLKECTDRIVAAIEVEDADVSVDWLCGRFPKDADEALDCFGLDDPNLVLDLVQMLSDEIERLQAIIDKLPKTADGVPVVPGRHYWKILGPEGRTRIERVGVGLSCEIVDAFGWSRCYSTREAAEAAGAAGDKKC